MEPAPLIRLRCGSVRVLVLLSSLVVVLLNDLVRRSRLSLQVVSATGSSLVSQDFILSDEKATLVPLVRDLSYHLRSLILNSFDILFGRVFFRAALVAHTVLRRGCFFGEELMLVRLKVLEEVIIDGD